MRSSNGVRFGMRSLQARLGKSASDRQRRWRGEKVTLHKISTARRRVCIAVAHFSAISTCRSKVSCSIGATGAIRCKWQRTAHKKAFGFLECLMSSSGRNTLQDPQSCSTGDAKDIFRDPVKRLQIAQAALALFYIWLYQIALPALFFMCVISRSSSLASINSRSVPCETDPPQRFSSALGKRGIAASIAMFQHCCADGESSFPRRNAIADIVRMRARLLAANPTGYTAWFQSRSRPKGSLYTVSINSRSTSECGAISPRP